jgi:sec-independent protein translocase protein TatB
MFDIGFSEIMLIAVVALVAIGPKDLPDILFRAGRMTRRAKIFLGGIRDQFSDVMHEAEVTHYRKQFGATVEDAEDDAEKKVANDRA